ncbi:hypothetical protein PIB30_080116 [Stylosanthes scabra]|uniref:Secreted protein n=1 Tax=Stylosanthes scabra TaxID=79078 RepID=A0ABU6ZQ32_9FABA|nr:hypothetical protein [Stylosanthes scabra]
MEKMRLDLCLCMFLSCRGDRAVARPQRVVALLDWRLILLIFGPRAIVWAGARGRTPVIPTLAESNSSHHELARGRATARRRQRASRMEFWNRVVVRWGRVGVRPGQRPPRMDLKARAAARTRACDRTAIYKSKTMCPPLQHIIYQTNNQVPRFKPTITQIIYKKIKLE